MRTERRPGRPQGAHTRRASARRGRARRARPSARSRGRGSSAGALAGSTVASSSKNASKLAAPTAVTRSVRDRRAARPPRVPGARSRRAGGRDARSGPPCWRGCPSSRRASTDGRPSRRAALITSGSGPPRRQRETISTASTRQPVDRRRRGPRSAGISCSRSRKARPAVALHLGGQLEVGRPRGDAGWRPGGRRASAGVVSPFCLGQRASASSGPRYRARSAAARRTATDSFGGRSGRSTVATRVRRLSGSPSGGVENTRSAPESSSSRKSAGRRFTGGALETTSRRGDRVSIGQQDRATEAAARLGGVSGRLGGGWSGWQRHE